MNKSCSVRYFCHHDVCIRFIFSIIGIYTFSNTAYVFFFVLLSSRVASATFWARRRSLFTPPSMDGLERLSQVCRSLLTTQTRNCQCCVNFWSAFATNLRKVTPERCRLTAFVSFLVGPSLTASQTNQYLRSFSDAVGLPDDDDVKRWDNNRTISIITRCLELLTIYRFISNRLAFDLWPPITSSQGT